MVLFATVGFTPTTVLAPLRQRQDIKEFHVFFGHPLTSKGEETLDVVRATCKGLSIPLREHAVDDAFDYTRIIQAFEVQYAKLGARDLVMNGSGGTRPMVMAATIFCFTRDVPFYYCDTHFAPDGRIVPLKAYRSLDRLGESQRAILKRLQKKGPADISTLAKELHVTASTASVHVSRLEQSGSITIERDGKRRIVHLLPELMQVDLGVAA